MRAGGALSARSARPSKHAVPRPPRPSSPEPSAAVESGSLVVDHDDATLHYDGQVYRLIQRRRLVNGGTEPLTRQGCRSAAARTKQTARRAARLVAECLGLRQGLRVLHEIAHVLLGHADVGYTVDVDLVAEDLTSQQERDADRKASAWAIPGKLRLSSPISKSKVCLEAHRLGVHPAIVVGRLHYTKKFPWSHLNNLIPRVKDQLAEWRH